MNDAAGADLHRLLSGVRLDLASARALRERMSGLSAREAANFDMWLRGYERHEGNRLRERVEATGDELLRRRDEIEADVEALAEEQRRVRREVRRGTIEPADAKKRLAGVGEGIARLRRRNDRLADDLADLKAFAEADPADVQAELLTRYPALRSSLPTLARSDLDGS